MRGINNAENKKKCTKINFWVILGIPAIDLIIYEKHNTEVEVNVSASFRKSDKIYCTKNRTIIVYTTTRSVEMK